jgi:ferredoxin-NADP reductase
VLCKGDGGGGSRYMHGAVRVGTLLEVDGPRNHFALEPRARHHILPAGGIGITPIVSMAREQDSRGGSAELH